MFRTIALGTLGFALGGPLGALALGGLGAAGDVEGSPDHEAARNDAIKRQNEIKHPTWNARVGEWQTVYQEPTPTRATSSRWVDPVDPEFQD